MPSRIVVRRVPLGHEVLAHRLRQHVRQRVAHQRRPRRRRGGQDLHGARRRAPRVCRSRTSLPSTRTPSAARARPGPMAARRRRRSRVREIERLAVGQHHVHGSPHLPAGAGCRTGACGRTRERPKACYHAARARPRNGRALACHTGRHASRGRRELRPRPGPRAPRLPRRRQPASCSTSSRRAARVVAAGPAGARLRRGAGARPDAQREALRPRRPGLARGDRGRRRRHAHRHAGRRRRRLPPGPRARPGAALAAVGPARRAASILGGGREAHAARASSRASARAT
jgi:hypothetical protein